MAELRGDMNDYINRVYFLDEELVVKRYKRDMCIVINYDKYKKMVARLEELEKKELN